MTQTRAEGVHDHDANMQVEVGTDCGNAPKKQLLRDFSIAFARRDRKAVLEAVSDDVVWHLIGDRDVAGTEALGEALDDLGRPSVIRLTLLTILTHGDQGSVSGTMAMSDHGTLHFCDVYKFSSHAKNAKIAQITSYWIR